MDTRNPITAAVLIAFLAGPAHSTTPKDLLEGCRTSFDIEKKSAWDIHLGSQSAGYMSAVLDYLAETSLICPPEGVMINSCHYFESYVIKNGAPDERAFPYVVKALQEAFPCKEGK